MHAIAFDQNYKIYGSGAISRVYLEFPGAKVKNGVDLSYPLPPTTAAMVRRYREQLRPLLATADNVFLFPGRESGPKESSGLSKHIGDLTRKRLGFRITAHQFRHLCAFIYLRVHPGDYETVRRFLGHKKIETTIRFYAGMCEEAAVALWDETLSKVRQSAAERLTAKRRRRRV